MAEVCWEGVRSGRGAGYCNLLTQSSGTTEGNRPSTNSNSVGRNSFDTMGKKNRVAGLEL